MVPKTYISDAADYGWISHTKLPGANGWASSMGGRLVQNVQRYGHNTSNTGKILKKLRSECFFGRCVYSIWDCIDRMGLDAVL